MLYLTRVAITRKNQGEQSADADPLALAARKKLFNLIHSSPGIHFQQLRKKARLSIGEAEYHIGVLKNKGLIQSEKMSGFLRFFPNTRMSFEQKQLLASIQSGCNKKIVLFLLEKSRGAVTDLCIGLSLSRKKAVNAVNQLLSVNVLQKKRVGLTNHYFLSNPALARKLLAPNLKPTKTISLEDKFEQLWEL